MKYKIKLWYYRNFGILSEKDAIAIGLTPVRNIYGDEINRLNCRSIWMDSHYRIYRVKSLCKSID